MDIIDKGERIVKSKFPLLIALIIAVSSLTAAVVVLFNANANKEADCEAKLDKERKRYDIKINDLQVRLHTSEQDAKIENQKTISAERELNRKLMELWLEVNSLRSAVKPEKDDI